MNFTSHTSHYRILNLGISLESDSERLRKIFDRDYRRFRRPRKEGDEHLSVSYDSRSSSPTLAICGQTIAIAGHPDPESYAYQKVLKEILNRLDGFTLLHAGVVGREGSVLIVSGPPRAGKSTIVLELVKRGFCFYSDDFCPVHEETGLIHPFPRSPWIKPESTDRSTALGTPDMRSGKAPIDLDASGVSVANTPGKAACLICLDHGQEAPATCTLRIALKDVYDRVVLDEFHKIGGVDVAKDGSDWKIVYPTGKGLTTGIQQLLEKHEDRIWNAYRDDDIHPDFDREPALAPMSFDAAAFRVLRDLKQDLPVQRPDKSPGMFFFELNKLLRGTACYNLRVGRLESTIDLILEAFDEARSR